MKLADRKEYRASKEQAKHDERERRAMPRQAYPSDLTDEQWNLLEPLIPLPAADAPNLRYERRDIVNAILYVLRSGCPWRLLPHDFPAWGTVYWYFRRWRCEGVWDQILDALRMQVRHKQGRDPEPSAAIIDSQSIKTSAVRGPEKGYDAGKKNLGAQTPPPGRYPRPCVGGQGHRRPAIRSARSQELTFAPQAAPSQD
jgi:transposase